MAWSTAEVERMAAAHFGGRTPRCPVCGAPVDVNEYATIGSKTVPLDLHCPRCGEDAGFSEPHLEELDLAWSQKQMRAIVNAYWRDGFALLRSLSDSLQGRERAWLVLSRERVS